ncbi:MAG: arsenical-resistance protein, partial [Gammaproteobacteria bacterium]
MSKQNTMGIFERYLTVWVGLCIVFGILLGQLAPGFARTLDGMSINI